jgi:hypothetical protein
MFAQSLLYTLSELDVLQIMGVNRVGRTTRSPSTKKIYYVLFVYALYER